MPYYPYRCLDCHKRFEVFLSYTEYGTRAVLCPSCNSQNVQRRITRVRIAKSEESRLEELADPSLLAGLEDDPKALGRMMRRMGEELGEELPPEFDEVVDRLEAGQTPEEIEKAMPDLAGPEGGDSEGESADSDDF
ncbi:MAG: zinc ribbon domain-containing protein [Anaerolineales bacterium]|nr:zinc ribbon domain-containing protein [Anaerolineales bacterium]MCS7249027.1 zinc ribbon domain-containing protein [Anaerolineales bacterium]MDW8162840.1 zinc ribbon domain-containing protein [Anaerolineales bacterium]MDW8447739.1 zinc ribbon domain-containing protein [Anaerolineales bacterium]